MDVAPSDGETRVVFGDRQAGSRERLASGAKIANDERRVCLGEGPEVVFDAEVDGRAGADEPAPTPAGELRWLGHFPETEHLPVEPPCLAFAASGHRELDVIDADDLDHAAGVEGFVGFDFAGFVGFGAVGSDAFGVFDFGSTAVGFRFGVRALDPAVAAFHASMS